MNINVLQNKKKAIRQINQFVSAKFMLFQELDYFIIKKWNKSQNEAIAVLFLDEF
jgi:hypothetical protein